MKDKEKFLEEAALAAGELFKIDDGGYDLNSIHSFVEGARLAFENEKKGFSYLDTNAVNKALVWASYQFENEVE